MDLGFTPAERAFAEEARSWLEANLPEVPARFATVEDELVWGRDWQARLAADRWAAIHWPEEYGGRGATPVEVALFNVEYARAGAPQFVNRVGLNLAGPTLLAHGTAEQRARWLPAILSAQEIWCQLFSEPGAGSDLAGLATRARPVDGGWRVTGQKVWTSYAQVARWGIALVRTDPDAPKHRGLSFLVVDMTSPGVEVRPLAQITGEAEFNEVFLDDVFVPGDRLVGGLHDGWRVANTTLTHERGTAFPFKEQVVHEQRFATVWARAVRAGVVASAGRVDPSDSAGRHEPKDSDAPNDRSEPGGRVEIADALVDAFVALRVLRLLNWRTMSRLAQGIEPGPESSVVKLVWTTMTRTLSDAALDLEGSDAPLYRPDDRAAQRQWLWSFASSIAGGTSEIQRTIIGERILGLPR